LVAPYVLAHKRTVARYCILPIHAAFFA
jgi:hypothetical protein